MNKKLKKLIDNNLVTIEELEQGIELLKEYDSFVRYYSERVEYDVCDGDCGVTLEKGWIEGYEEDPHFLIIVRDYSDRDNKLTWDNMDYFTRFDKSIGKQRETTEELSDRGYRHPTDIVKTLIKIVETGEFKNFLEGNTEDE